MWKATAACKLRASNVSFLFALHHLSPIRAEFGSLYVVRSLRDVRRRKGVSNFSAKELALRWTVVKKWKLASFWHMIDSTAWEGRTGKSSLAILERWSRDLLTQRRKKRQKFWHGSLKIDRGVRSRKRRKKEKGMSNEAAALGHPAGNLALFTKKTEVIEAENKELEHNEEFLIKYRTKRTPR